MKTRGEKTLDRLEKLTRGAVVIDAHGDAWQCGGLGYWYRAFDSDGVATWNAAQFMGHFEVVAEGNK